MLLQDLRRRTRLCHDELEKSPILMRLANPQKLNDYTDALSAFYGFYFPIEQRYENDHPDLDQFYSPKSQLIQNDLKSFQLEISKIKLCDRLPKLPSSCHWLGLLYTLEGSAHGRKFLWPKIQKALRLQSGNVFFTNQSANLENDWRIFCTNMENYVSDDREKEYVIEGAIGTFQSLKQWFDGFYE